MNNLEVRETEKSFGINLKGIFHKKKLVRFGIYLVLLTQLLFTGYPFVWMLISSFKTDNEYFANPWGFPEKWNFDNYVNAWNEGVSDYLFNSIYITFFTVVGLLIVSSLISYYLAVRPFKGSKLILGALFLAMLIPVHSTLIPLFNMANFFGIQNTFWALFFPYIGFHLPIAVFLLYGFFTQIPKELEEAAIMDGCNIYQVFFKIYLPLSRPILATVTILSFFGIMNDFVFPLVMVSDDSLKTLPLGLMMFKGSFSSSYSLISAALVISTAPIIILYMFLQKYITKGVVAGAVKG